jgi:hypothetical protein
MLLSQAILCSCIICLPLGGGGLDVYVAVIVLGLSEVKWHVRASGMSREVSHLSGPLKPYIGFCSAFPIWICTCGPVTGLG